MGKVLVDSGQSLGLATEGDDMNAKVMTLSEIRRAGIELLTQNLGAVGMVRFLQQSDLDWGDYTKERQKWLGNPSLSEIADGIKAMRRGRPNKAN